jgi:hypothetical protein
MNEDYPPNLKEYWKKQDEEVMKKEPHPWGAFLDARLKVIYWMEKELHRSDKEIAIELSMNEKQVYLIRTNPINREKCETPPNKTLP